MKINYYRHSEHSSIPGFDVELCLSDDDYVDIDLSEIRDSDIVCFVLNKDYFSLIGIMNNCVTHINKDQMLLVDKIKSQCENIDIKLYRNLIKYVLLDNDYNKMSALQKLCAFELSYGYENSYLLGYSATTRNETDFGLGIMDFEDAIDEINKVDSKESRFKACCDFIITNKIKIEQSSIITFNNFSDFFKFVLSKVIERNEVIKKCKNCGKYFCPYMRSDAIYCDNLSPQDPSKTCKIYGAAKTRAEKEKNDEATRLYRQIYMSKQMLVKRNADILEYKEIFEKYKKQAKKWKKQVRDGDKTEQEFIAWLQDVKSNKYKFN